MLAAQGALSIIQKPLANQKLPAVGFQKLVFAHKATAGQQTIVLGSLTTPPEMSSNGFSNPTTTALAAANLLTYQNNLTLISSRSGPLIRTLSYTISSSTVITLTTAALEGEIFVGTIDYTAVTGSSVAPATATAITGVLAAGTTDIALGASYITNYNSSAQIGAVTLFIDGIAQQRNPGNSSTSLTANYYEVDNGAGSFSVLRMNVADPTNPRNYAVIPNALVAQQTSGSLQSVIEAAQGQLNNMAQYVAALAGLPTSTVLGSAPTNVDLTAFGNRVFSLEQTRALLAATNTFTAFQLIPGRTDGSVVPKNYPGEVIAGTIVNSGVTFTSAGLFNVWSLPLTAGIWVLYGQVGFNGSSANSLTDIAEVGWSTSTSSFTTFGGITYKVRAVAISGAEMYLTAPTLYLNVASATTCYMNADITYPSGTYTNDATVTVAYAVRIA